MYSVQDYLGSRVFLCKACQQFCTSLVITFQCLCKCLEFQFDHVISDRIMILQRLHLLSNMLRDCDILNWEFFLARFDALSLEAQIDLENSGELACLTGYNDYNKLPGNGLVSGFQLWRDVFLLNGLLSSGIFCLHLECKTDISLVFCWFDWTFWLSSSLCMYKKKKILHHTQICKIHLEVCIKNTHVCKHEWKVTSIFIHVNLFLTQRNIQNFHQNLS